MKSVIYTRVSKDEQTTQRQVNDLKRVEGFEVVKIFSENISGFTKSMEERKGLQSMLKYVEQNNIQCILISEISRLGRNTHETLALIRDLQQRQICIYIHNLRITFGADTDKDRLINTLIITILSDMARLESENSSYRIKSGIRNRKAKGLHVGRKVESYETKEKFLSKYKKVISYLNEGLSYSEIQKITGAAPATISKVKKALAGEYPPPP